MKKIALILFTVLTQASAEAAITKCEVLKKVPLYFGGYYTQKVLTRGVVDSDTNALLLYLDPISKLRVNARPKVFNGSKVIPGLFAIEVDQNNDGDNEIAVTGTYGSSFSLQIDSNEYEIICNDEFQY